MGNFILFSTGPLIEKKTVMQTRDNNPASELISIGERLPTRSHLSFAYSMSMAADLKPANLDRPAILPTPANISITWYGSPCGGRSSHQTSKMSKITT